MKRNNGTGKCQITNFKRQKNLKLKKYNSGEILADGNHFGFVWDL